MWFRISWTGLTLPWENLDQIFPGGWMDPGGIRMRTAYIIGFKFHPNKENLSSPFFLFSNEKKIKSYPRIILSFWFQFGRAFLHLVLPECLATTWRCQGWSDHGHCSPSWPPFKFLTLATKRRVWLSGNHFLVLEEQLLTPILLTRRQEWQLYKWRQH